MVNKRKTIWVFKRLLMNIAGAADRLVLHSRVEHSFVQHQVILNVFELISQYSPNCCWMPNPNSKTFTHFLHVATCLMASDLENCSIFSPFTMQHLTDAILQVEFTSNISVWDQIHSECAWCFGSKEALKIHVFHLHKICRNIGKITSRIVIISVSFDEHGCCCCC